MSRDELEALLARLAAERGQARAGTDGEGAEAGDAPSTDAEAGRVPLAAVVELTEYVDQVVTDLRKLVGEVVGVGDDRDLGDALVQVERVLRAGEAASITVVDDVSRRDLHRVDGHFGVRNWVKATVRASGSVAQARERCGRLFELLPEAIELLGEGRLGVAQVRQLGHLAANRRVRDELPAAAGQLLDWALHDDYATFWSKSRDWEQAIDQDGAHDDAEVSHQQRRCHLSQLGSAFLLAGQFGVLQGEAMREILDAFADAEWRNDQDTDAVRTPAQRRADALLAIFEAAAGAPLQGKPLDVCVNIVIDWRTYELRLAELIADRLDPLHRYRTDATYRPYDDDPCGHTDIDPDVDVGAVRRMCHTAGGAPVDAVQAVIYSIVGHTRRVVLGAKGQVIDLGRRVRCFTGAARQAVVLQASVDGSTRCIWPSCGRRHCQIDHATEWSDQGRTDAGNGDPMCGGHNLLKTTGYKVRRDHHGRWHTHRPDGTEITAA